MNRSWKDHASLVIKGLVRLEQWVAIALLVTILATMGLQVIARYVFGSPISWSEEVARLGMIWLTFIAAGFVAARRQHIAVDLFGPEPRLAAGDPEQNDLLDSENANDRRSSMIGRWLVSSHLASAVVLVSSLMLLLGGLRFVWRVYPVASPSIGLSMTYWYGAASVGLALLAIHAIADLCGIDQVDAADDGEPSNLEAS